MKKIFPLLVPVIFMLFLVLPTTTSAAIADGTYSVNYQVNKPGSNSASMANDYFLKPAKLTVNNGKMSIQLTIKNSSWVTQFNPPGGASVISSNTGADQRVVQFNIGSFNPLTVGMKIDIEDIDYHHAYSVDFVFDGSGLPEAKPQQETAPPAAPSNNTTEPKSNPSPSSGSNTSSNKEPATASGKADKTSTAEQSKPVQNEADTSQEAAQNKDQQDAAQTEEVEVENPETSDALPLASLVAFMAAAIIFVRTKQAKTN
ncbi:heme uptake protein IsdC [Lysinibacillus sp. 3P01SB]|uniref:heme uptake protein IsdC n=1 Tax=Lysinibacillus sp. 3P01SB TaxID=3132284 RepID=UPI0039A541FC